MKKLSLVEELHELMERIMNNDTDVSKIFLNVGGTLYPIEEARVDIDGDLIVEATGL